MRLIAKGKFAYEQERNRKLGNDSVDTFFQMWVYEPKESPQAIAVLGWWSTEEARVPSNIEKLAQLTAGTAVVSPAAAAAAGADSTSEAEVTGWQYARALLFDGCVLFRKRWRFAHAYPNGVSPSSPGLVAIGDLPWVKRK